MPSQGTKPAPRRLAIILLHWRNTGSVRLQLERMANWSDPPAVWLVENEVWPDTLPGGLEMHRVQPGANLGYAGGINLAGRQIPATHFPFTLLMNVDLEIGEDEVKALRAVLENDQGDLAGPLLVENEGGRERLYAGGRDPVRWSRTRRPWQHVSGAPQILPVDYVPGTVCLIRTALLKELDGLEEAFFFSGEVADFCLRARALGKHCVIYTGACVPHHTEPSTRSRETLYTYYSLRNRFLLLARHRPQRAGWWRLVWLARGLAMTVLRLAGGRTQAARACALALRDGWTGNFGPSRHVFPS